jgi:hypothetical protein
MTEPRRHRLSLLLLLATCAALTACGGSNGGGDKATPTEVADNQPAGATPESPDVTTASWRFCASEQGMCNFTGTRQVRYGTGGLYKYATYNGGVRCNNSVFGDPMPGKVKACSVSVAQTGESGSGDSVETPTPPSVKNGRITLAWIAPQTNADGSPLTDLAGYRVRYGTSSGSYVNTVQIDNPNALNHVLQGLPASTYYLTVTAFNSANIESHASVEVSKAIE